MLIDPLALAALAAIAWILCGTTVGDAQQHTWLAGQCGAYRNEHRRERPFSHPAIREFDSKASESFTRALV